MISRLQAALQRLDVVTVERLKLVVELMIFALGALWFGLQVFVGEFNPAAVLTVTSGEIVSTAAGPRLPFTATFSMTRAKVTLTSRSENEQMPGILVEASTLGGTRLEVIVPRSQSLNGATLPAGDGTTFGGVVVVPPGFADCVVLSATVSARRAYLPGWFGSNWSSSTVSCPKKPEGPA